MILKFSVPGRPIPTARPRVMKTGRTFMPTRTVKAQRAVGEAALIAARGKRPLFESGPVYVNIMACFAYAKGTPKKDIAKGWVHMTGTPDLDNLAKTVLDGCNKVIYSDDAQIVELTVSKWRVDNADDVGFHVEISDE